MKGLPAILLCAFLSLLSAWALQPSQVVVVYNASSKLSRETAQRYAQLRHIPQDQLVGLEDVRGGHITRLDFEEKVRMPLLAEGRRKGWMWPSGYTKGSHKRIHAMVLMPDLPLGIRPAPRKKGEPAPDASKAQHAAVDSELMVLGANLPSAGMLGNPCYGKNISLGFDTPPVMAVCRIDGPDAASISRMIEDPLRVEKQGLWGWSVVDQGGPYKEADEWLAEVAKLARAAGQPLFHETSKATLAEAFPLMTDTAVYFGWYTHPANGPFRRDAGGDFRFAPGAVAVHLHSNSASSVKDAKYWAPALLSRGAAVTAGNVFEPYLSPTLHFDIFYDRLLKGSCVAEAALMASPVVSWQSIILGDPLYRPFAAMKKETPNHVHAQWRQLYLTLGRDVQALRQAVREREHGPHGAALAEMFAWHCTELGLMEDAAEFFATACGRYTELRDRTRTAIMAATVLAAGGKRERAQQVLSPWLAAGQDSPYLPALQQSLDTISGKKPEAKKK